MTAGAVERLGPDDRAEAWELSRLAFGSDPASGPPAADDPPPRGDTWGVRDAQGRLTAKAMLLDYEQTWGGRPVPMGGVAGVAVHPDARGTGQAQRLLGHLLDVMSERGHGVSALFPTVVPLYRGQGWEVVGSLDDTRISTRDLAPEAGAGSCRVRTGTVADAERVQALYAAWAAGTGGALSRRGRPFPEGAAGAFEADVVAIAEDAAGHARGYASYDRGRGYRSGAGELRLWELVAQDAEAAGALLASISRWSPVAATTLWRGPVQEPARLTSGVVPAPVESLPWMLRVVDPVTAVAARGFPAEVTAQASFELVDPQRPASARAWRLSVADGHGALEPVPAAGVPRLHVRGLALLLASAADTAELLRCGLLDAPLRGVDAAFGGRPPVLLDYF